MYQASTKKILALFVAIKYINKVIYKIQLCLYYRKFGNNLRAIKKWKR